MNIVYSFGQQFHLEKEKKIRVEKLFVVIPYLSFVKEIKDFSLTTQVPNGPKFKRKMYSFVSVAKLKFMFTIP